VTAPDWEREAPTWPHSDHSRFVTAGGTRTHLQEVGDAGRPCLFLVHGTGSSSHSFHKLVDRLRDRFHIVSVDLPGHGFSSPLADRRLSLPAVADAVSAVLAAEGIRPDLVCGHSAGAAVLARMVLDGGLSPQTLVSLNGAFYPFKGVAGALFPPMAKLLFLNPISSWFFAGQAQNRRNVARLLRSQGDHLGNEDIGYYARLLSYPGHVAGTMEMMAHWELPPLLSDMRRFPIPLHAVVGENDRAVPPRDADALVRLVPDGTIHRLSGLGHLAHEMAPDRVAEILLGVAVQSGLSI